MNRTARLLLVAAVSLLAMFAVVLPAGAQTNDTTPAVGGSPAVGADGYVLGVTTIAPAPQVSSTGALPYTGNDSLPMIQIGVGLLAVGLIVTFAVRKHNAAERA